MEYFISVLKDENRIDELIELFATGLGDTTREYWKWRLFTPNGVVCPEVIIAENENKRMVGMSTVFTNIYGDGAYKAVFFCDWVIHPDFRGQGLMGKIYKYIYEMYSSRGYDFMMTFPNSNSTPIFQKYGFDEKNIGCWVTGKTLFVHSSQAKNAEKYGYDFIFSDKCILPDSIHQSDARLYRSKEFMNWKFDENPDTVFKWLTVFKGKAMVGYFVYALNHGRLRTAVNVYDCDYVGMSPEAIKYAVSLLKRQGNYLSILCETDDVSSTLLTGAGLFQSEKNVRWFTKPFEGKVCPEQLSITRIDIDF